MRFMRESMTDIQKIKARCGYAGKPQQWQYGFDLAIRELQAANSIKVPEGFVLVEASEFESLKSDNEHFTKSCIDWTDRAYKQRAKVDHIKNEVERFKQSGTNLDLSRFLDNLIEFSTFKHDKEFDGFVLVPRELSDEEARKHAEAIFKKVEHLARYEQRDLSESEFESFKNRWIDARTLTIQFDWKAMIKVQVKP